MRSSKKFPKTILELAWIFIKQSILCFWMTIPFSGPRYSKERSKRKLSFGKRIKNIIKIIGLKLERFRIILIK